VIDEYVRELQADEGAEIVDLEPLIAQERTAAAAADQPLAPGALHRRAVGWVQAGNSRRHQSTNASWSSRLSLWSVESVTDAGCDPTLAEPGGLRDSLDDQQ
jgi:hypothetical protein